MRRFKRGRVEVTVWSRLRARVLTLLTSTTVVAATFGVATLAPQATPAAAAAPNPPMASEANPNTVTPAGSLKFGGRIEALSINPVNPQIILAASELGGLWRSTDGADSWTHVDNLPLTRMYDVKFAPADASLVIATGDNDGASPNRGGIWRSTDGGATWSRPAGAVDGTSCGNASTAGAHRLDIAGTTPGSLSVFVGTDCGIAVSGNSGATWTLHYAAGPSNAVYYDVKTATVAGQIQANACGDGGYTRSVDGGVTWSAYAGDNSELFGGNALGFPPCFIAVAPNDPNTVFISSFRRSSMAPACGSLLLMATDANAAAPTWTNLNACPNGDRNGRWPFVIAHPDPTNPTTQFQVYFGDNTRVTIQTCSYAPTTCAAGPWPYYDGTNPHNGTDPTGVVFDPTIPSGCPVFESGDGGVYQPSDCSTNPPNWTMKNTGLNALDALNIAGTVYTSPAHSDVYFGTQDDGMFPSTDGGVTYNRFDYDIYGLMADHDQNTAASPGSQVLWRDAAYGPPSPSSNHVNFSNEDISSNSVLSSQPPLPPGNNPSDNFSATQFGYHRYAFITPDIAPMAPPAPQPNWKMYVTTDAGSTWTQMGPNAPGSPVGNPQATGTAANPVFNVILSVGGSNKLYRLAGPMNSSAVWTDITSNLSNPTTFGVHPSNPLLMYANDASLNQVMKSTNGGASWVADTNLTTLVQRGGQFPFASGGSQVAAFGFDGNSTVVMAGTNNAGVFASTDGGANWFSVTGAENVPRIAGFFFDQRTHSIYFSSGGRGMWKIGLPVADLSITKTSSPNPVIAGNQLTYTVTVTNNSTSPSTANAIGVIDTLPNAVTFLTSSDGCTEGPPGQLACAVPSLAPGASFTFTITVLVHSNAVVGSGGATTITNTATVSEPGTVDPNPADNTATATTTVVDSADLSVTKLCKPDTTVLAGTPINCSVFVDNHGPSDARNVVIDDATLANGAFTISNVAVTPGPTNCAVTPITGGQDLTCTAGPLAAASTTQTGRVTVTYTITATEGVDINNVATVRSDTPDPNTANNSAQVNLTVTALADLSLTKTGPASVVAGTPITWTLTATNNGPSTATNVAIVDTVPAGVTITSVSAASASVSCTSGAAGDPSQPAVCNFGTLAPGATTATMTIVATVNPRATGVLENDARVTSATFDNNTANNLAHTFTNVTVQSSIAVAIAATPNPVTAGTALSYQLTVSNGGPSTATAVTLTDPLPAGVTFGSTGGVGTCGYQTNTNTVTCQLPKLDPGQSEVVFIYTNVKSSTPAGPMTNSATASAAGSPNNTNSVTTPVQTVADLGIVLNSDMLVYKPSTTIHYQITVTNSGPSDAYNVVITQALPAVKQGKYVSNNIGCAPPSGSTLTCKSPPVAALATIVAGGSVTFQVNFFITGNKGTITSVATVTTSPLETDPAAANNTSTRVVTVK